MKSSTTDHQLFSQDSQGLSANFLPQDDVGREALAELIEIAEEENLDVLHVL